MSRELNGNRARCTAGRAAPLLLAAFAAPGIGFAQSPSFVAGSEPILAVVDRIEEIQSRAGVVSSDLIDPLMALGLLYREHGDDALAQASIERARQLVRANYGLYSIEEAAPIRQLVQIMEARGDIAAAWELEQMLLGLLERYPNDLRAVPILHEIANKRLAVLTRYQNGEFPPEIVLGCYYDVRSDDERTCNSGSRRAVVFQLRDEVYWYRQYAQSILARNERWTISDCGSPLAAPEIPGKGTLRKLDEQTWRDQAVQHLHGRTDYVACLEAEHLRAVSSAPVPSELARIAAERDAAVCALERSKAVYEERFGSLAEFFPQPRYRRPVFDALPWMNDARAKSLTARAPSTGGERLRCL